MTKIEWTRGDDGSAGETWNPTTGCDRVSAGCDHCYALTMAARLKTMGSAKYQTDGDPRTSGPGFGVAVHEDALTLPLRWRKPRRVFVNSMSDLFHPRVPDEFIVRMFAVMAATPQHTYQILTKRPARMRALLSRGQVGTAGFFDDIEEAMPEWTHAEPAGWPLPNLWLGTSVEDQEQARRRVPLLRDTLAAVRFLSCEPLLGPIDLTGAVDMGCEETGPAIVHTGFSNRTDYGTGVEYDCDHQFGIDWVIVGGESGPRARPMHPDWARSLRDQCQAAGAPFFFKQWGEWCPSGATGWGSVDPSRSIIVGPPVDEHGSGRELVRVGKKVAGRELDGRTWDEFPVVRS